MTTVSPASSSLLQALANNGNASSGTANSLLDALGNAQGVAGATGDELLQTLVTLTSANGASDGSAVQTYNAQGLLNRIQAAMPENPLFATTDASGSDSSNGRDSLLAGLLDSSQSPAGGTSPSQSATSAGLLQLFQQSPTLATAYVDGEVTQSLFSDMA
jgi:hypothetical protein